MRVENILLNSKFEAKIVYLGEDMIIKDKKLSELKEWSAPELLDGKQKPS